MNRRANLGEIRERYEKIKKEVLVRYPRTKQVVKRLEVMTCLHRLIDETARGMALLRSLKEDDRAAPAAPWLKADPPIAALRAYMVSLLGMIETAAGATTEGNEALTRLREQISREPAPGFELIDTCQVLVWYVQMYLFLQTQVEAASATGLRGETCEDHIDEAVRAAMPGQAQDQTLARLKLLEWDDCDEFAGRELGRVRKYIGRRRSKIDLAVGLGGDEFRRAVNDTIQGMLRALPEDAEVASKLRDIRTRLNDEGNADTRRIMKQWLTVLEVIGHISRI